MTQIEKNKAKLWMDIQELAHVPLTAASASSLVNYMTIYDALCRASCPHPGMEIIRHNEDSNPPRFDRQMAMAWTAGMVNADGTKGPHWTMEDTEKLRKQHGLDYQPEKFWAVMNSLYSDYCEALRESSASMPEVYVRLAKAWINDKDAVPDKAVAYYTHIVKH